jgi:hypothetical protein
MNPHMGQHYLLSAARVPAVMEPLHRGYGEIGCLQGRTPPRSEGLPLPPGVRVASTHRAAYRMSIRELATQAEEPEKGLSVPY